MSILMALLQFLLREWNNQAEAPPTRPSSRPLSRSRNRPRAHDEELPAISICLFGRSKAGKSSLIHAILKKLLNRAWPSGFMLAPLNPQQLADWIKERRTVDEALHSGRMVATLQQKCLDFQLVRGDRALMNVRLIDNVGQVALLGGDAGEDERQRGELYFQGLADADVAWYLMPLPPSPVSDADRCRFQEDLEIGATQLREALTRRPRGNPLAFATLLTKVDGAFSSVELAQKALTEKRLRRWLRNLTEVANHAHSVTEAAIFPVSTFGFGNGRRLAATGSSIETPHYNMDDEDAHEIVSHHEECDYILDPARQCQPFNIAPLIIWSILSAMLNQKVSVDVHGTAPLEGLCRTLSSDLNRAYRWWLPLKGTMR